MSDKKEIIEAMASHKDEAEDANENPDKQSEEGR